MGDELREVCSQESPPLDRVKPLIRPESVSATNDKGDLPLHFACYNGASLDTIEFLVLQWPESISQTDDNGCIPLHWACFGKAPVNVIDYLILRWPDSTKAASKNGEVALHYACHDVARWKVVKHLVKKRPSSLKHSNLNCMLPLHVACSSEFAQLKVVKYLVEHNPNAVTAKTKNGELPLDLARQNGAPQDVIDYLQHQQDNAPLLQTDAGYDHTESLTVKSMTLEFNNGDVSYEVQLLETDEHPAAVNFLGDSVNL